MKRGEKNSKKVIVTTNEGETLTFPSAEKAATELQMNAMVLRKYCREQKELTSGIKKGFKFKYEQIVFIGDQGSRNTPPSSLGELIMDLKIYPKEFALEIDQDINFDLITQKGKQGMRIQPSYRLRQLLLESEINQDDQSSSNQDEPK